MLGINTFFNTVFQTAWKPVRSFYDGLSGTTSANGLGVFRNAQGEAILLNPAQKLARRLSQRGKQAITGYEYDINGNIINKNVGWLGRHVNRASGAAHLVGDITLGTAGTVLGWGARGAVKTAAITGTAIGVPLALRTAKAAGRIMYEGAEYGVKTASGAVTTAWHMSRSTPGQMVLFGVASAATTTVPLGSALMREETAGKLGVYIGRPIDPLPGTMASYGALENTAPVLDNMGADGDLVFALHNLR